MQGRRRGEIHQGHRPPAHEGIEYSGYNSYKHMPAKGDLIHLEGGLCLCGTGTMWTKKEGWFGDLVLFGTASASEGKREEEGRVFLAERELKARTERQEVAGATTF